jgi:hypothetical protein
MIDLFFIYSRKMLYKPYSLPYGHWCIQAYKNFVSNGISPELAEERALRVKLSKKYQNECVSHIS